MTKVKKKPKREPVPADHKVVWHHVKTQTWTSSGLRFKIVRRHNTFFLEDVRWPRRKAKKFGTLNEAKAKVDQTLQLEGAW